jgi:hypothetical protein
MFGFRKLAAVVFLSTIISPVTSTGQDRHRDVLPVIIQYLDLVVGGSYDIAGDMWTPETIERSGRFGIKFSDIALKVDCNSPVIRNLDELSSQMISPIRNYETLQENAWYKLEYADIHGNALLRHHYYMQRRGDWFWFSYPQDFYSEGWSITESRYLRVRVHPDVEKYLNPVVLAEADLFVEEMAARLEISAPLLEQIARSKIEYFYCASDSVVELLSGFLAKGTVDLASNDVISADFPHFHELTHLLINIRLQEMPLYTLPLAREGLAVNLAGRWGKHPAALMDLAVFLYREELLTFDSILTMSGFMSESGADIVYPVAGVFCGYLIERLGMERVLELYVRLSGKFDYVNGLTTQDIQNIIVEAVDADDWSGLINGFNAYITRYVDRQMVALPGSGRKGSTVVKEDHFTVREAGDWIAFEFTGEPSDSVCEGNLVFAPVEELAGHVSTMFESQYGASQPFEGYRFGVRYDRNEIGLYDYAANLLVAKYIWGITPSDDYYDAERNKIMVRFRKSLLKGRLPRKGQCRLLPL